MTSFIALKIVYNKKKIQFLSWFAIYFILWSEKRYISFVASSLMNYVFLTSLDEINGIFIQKI